MLSVENGADWVKPLLKADRYLGASIRTRGGQVDKSGDFITTTMAETMRRHLWVVPYPEEDPREAIEVLGEDHVLFGSDYPHPEGLAAPADYVGRFVLAAHEQRKLSRDNFAGLMGLSA